ncbi:hypothetical protein H8356DRAFT_1711236 [Neocallimastix lanati (nom. inval.)]|nr:hypothetical protein H8356DRAFT_1711236 [Neocallimastix sp. JGI-2020a]
MVPIVYLNPVPLEFLIPSKIHYLSNSRSETYNRSYGVSDSTSDSLSDEISNTIDKSHI